MDAFVTMATREAMKAAAERFRILTSGRNIDEQTAIALTDAIKYECKQTLPAALNDAREAFECGMMQIARETFVASFRLAGIRATNKLLDAAI